MSLVQTSHSITNFATNLFNLIAAGNRGSFAVSPFNIHDVFSAASIGAVGETQQQLLRALAVKEPSSFSINDLVQGWNSIRQDIPHSNEAFTLRRAAGIFVKDDIVLDANYQQLVSKSHGAKIDTVRPGDESRINQWISDITNDKIKNILPTGIIDNITAAMLVSALYLKAQWENPLDGTRFKRSTTKDAPFYTTESGGMQHTVKMMHREGYNHYINTGGISMIQLPFKVRDFSMVFALPDGNPTTADDFAKRMEQNGGWSTMISRLLREETKGVVTEIPKFTRRTILPSVKSFMQDLGAVLAFDIARADFRNMFSESPYNVYVSKAIHETFVDVNEDGVEATAATIMLIALGGSIFQHEVTFRADRPFAWAILSPYGPLFMGWEAKPISESDA